MQLNLKSAALSYTHGCIEVKGDAIVRKFPIASLSAIHLDTKSQIDAGLLYQLIEQHVPIFINNSKQLPLSLIREHSLTPRLGLKRSWYAVCQDEPTRFALAVRLVRAKLKRQRHLISQLAKSHQINNMDIQAAIATNTDLSQCEDYATLLGCEGAGAHRYFRALRHFIPSWCEFSKRQKRPPPDTANALLSLTYTLVQDVVTRSLLKQGFDPVFGLLHQDTDFRYSLSCDVMELWRTTADSWVLKLLTDAILQQHHFVVKHNATGVRLSQAGQTIFYRQWYLFQKELEQEVARQVKYFAKKVTQHA